jgi:hypothetical protein
VLRLVAEALGAGSRDGSALDEPVRGGRHELAEVGVRIAKPDPKREEDPRCSSSDSRDRPHDGARVP